MNTEIRKRDDSMGQTRINTGYTVGILGAMASEMEAIKAMVELPQTELISGTNFVRGSIRGVDVVCATCGVGKVFAGMCAQTMILRYQPDLVINIGVAGSLSPRLNIGDIAVASSVVQHDMDASPIGFPAGLIPGIDVINLPCSADVVRMMEACADALGFHHESGVIATGDVFVQDGAQKKQICQSFDAIACEMEGGSIGQVCYVNETDFCILRAISDNGDESAQNDYDMSLDMAADRATRVLERFLMNLGVGQKVLGQ